MRKPGLCPNPDCRQENRDTCYRCGWYEGTNTVGKELLRLWDITPTIRRSEEILLLVKHLEVGGK